MCFVCDALKKDGGPPVPAEIKEALENPVTLTVTRRELGTIMAALSYSKENPLLIDQDLLKTLATVGKAYLHEQTAMTEIWKRYGVDGRASYLEYALKRHHEAEWPEDLDAK